MFNTIPGHTQYTNILRFGKHMICDVLTAFAEAIAEDYRLAVTDLIRNHPMVFGNFWLQGAFGKRQNRGPVVIFQLRSLLTKKCSYQKANHYVRINTIMYLCQELSLLLRDLNSFGRGRGLHGE